MSGLFFDIPRNSATAVGLPLIAGFLSGSRTRNVVQGTWYNSLLFPPGRPPKKAFPIVWSTLYVAMGYASHIAVKSYDSAILQATRDNITTALGLYYAQLGMNLLWTPLFFGQKKVGLALVDSVLMAGSTIYMTNLLHEPTDGQATYFLLPYCAWLSYATYLNAGIWWYNRGRNVPKLD